MTRIILGGFPPSVGFRRVELPLRTEAIMDDESNRDLLIALSLLPFLTPNRTRLLLENFQPLEAACNASSIELQGLLRLPPAEVAQVKNPLTTAAQRDVAALRDSVVTLTDEEYPVLLREIADPPLVLHVRGDRSLLATPSVAVVGSRRASPYGELAAEKLTATLARAGLSIVSGLARGIDATAHRACLDAGGRTIAVLGTGIDVSYPRSNDHLRRRIERDGLVVSEFPPRTPPRPENFPMRNRVISGLALGTVVVEASQRSGSLITARMAAEQGREVFAVPGQIFAPGSEGGHRLIQSGAKLTHDAVDVLEELNLEPLLDTPESPPDPLPADTGERETLRLFRVAEPLHADAIPEKSGRSLQELAAVLLQLEMDGWIRALPGGRWMRVK